MGKASRSTGLAGRESKSGYARRIGQMPEPDFWRETERVIIRSAERADDKADDAHWQVRACFHEAVRRKGSAQAVLTLPLNVPWDMVPFEDF